MRGGLSHPSGNSIRMFKVAILILIQSINVVSLLTIQNIHSNKVTPHVSSSFKIQEERKRDSNHCVGHNNKFNFHNQHENKRRRNDNFILYTDKSDIKDKEGKDGKKLGGTIATRNLFLLTEIFGKITTIFQSSKIEDINLDKNANTNNDIVNYTSENCITTQNTEIIAEKIREEYEAIFWATGNMDTSLWANDCTFADPFSSFGGDGSTVRFKKNADNLGKLVLNPKMKITSFKIDYADKMKNKNLNININGVDKKSLVKIKKETETEMEIEIEMVREKETILIENKKKTGKVIGKNENENNLNDYDCVRIGWVFNSKLNLPWKPILAAAGETFHYLDANNGLIIRYEETWKSKPWDVVKKLFQPTKMD